MLSRLIPFIPKPPLVAVVRLAGMISPTPQPMRSALSLPALAGTIQRACTMRGVKALALAINSPGGSPVQSALIARRIRQLAKEHDLPIFAFIEDVAASGGYWLACAADEIYAERSSIVGSIGVVSAGFGFEEAIRKIGVERRVHHQGANKAMLDPFRAEDPDDVERLLEIQRAIHDDFKDHVRDRRGKRLKGEEDDLFNGDIWTGTAALNLGLIDGIGELRGVMRDRFGDKVQLRVVGAERVWLRRRLGMHGDWAEPRSITTGVIAAIEERALWSRFGL
ncbi:MAG: S49 family peptidase [Alphaproteobacteria bacterium]|jgi:signal peptide peptidase SppA